MGKINKQIKIKQNLKTVNLKLSTKNHVRKIPTFKTFTLIHLKSVFTPADK